MADIPDRDEIERILGGSLPDDIPIELFEDFPDEHEGFELVAYLKSKWAVLKKSIGGKLVKIYLIAVGLGCPIPTPWNLAVKLYEGSQPLQEVVYAHLFESCDSEDNFLWVEMEGLADDSALSAEDLLYDESFTGLSSFVLPVSSFSS